MAESPQFETLVQSLSSTLQSLEQKRKELKKQGHSTGIWVGGIILYRFGGNTNDSNVIRKSVPYLFKYLWGCYPFYLDFFDTCVIEC